MPRRHRQHLSAAALVVALFTGIAGCAVHVQRAQVRIEDDLATTFKISATLHQGSPELQQGVNAELFGKAEAGIRERAEACGATYKSYRKPNTGGLAGSLLGDTIQMEIERRYATAHELDDGLRCADLDKPPTGYRLETTEGLFKKTLTIAFDLPNQHLLGRKQNGQFPDELVIIVPWKVVRVDDRTESPFGKLEYAVHGDDQVRMRFVEDEAAVQALYEQCALRADACMGDTDGLTVVRVAIVAEKLKLELQTILAVAGIILSIATLLFGSGIARKRLENRKASRAE
jgi:hypothetical protein